MAFLDIGFLAICTDTRVILGAPCGSYNEGVEWRQRTFTYRTTMGDQSSTKSQEREDFESMAHLEPFLLIRESNQTYIPTPCT